MPVRKDAVGVGSAKTKKNQSFEGIEGNMIWHAVRNHGIKLFPFFKALALYFIVFVPFEQPSIIAMTLKCLPILGLVFFVFMRVLNETESTSFSRRILFGLAFSCLGDAYLVWPVYFPHGMAAFGMAQIFYCWAFGFKHPHWTLGAVIYGINTVALAIIVPNMVNVPLQIVIGLPIYSMLLMTTVWRGIARVESSNNWTWSKIYSTVGVLVFAVSDSILGVSQFFTPIPYSQMLIMSTYYIAQFCIALSTISANEDV